MIKKILFTAFFVMTLFSCFSQDISWEQKKQQFKAEKVAYITTKMNFTVEEAQKFWPVYNKYDEILDGIGEKRRKNFNPRCIDVDTLCEAECMKILKTSFALDEEELNARRNFYKELRAVFSDKKIMRYYHAEREFRRRLISEKQGQGASFGKSFKEN